MNLTSSSRTFYTTPVGSSKLIDITKPELDQYLKRISTGTRVFYTRGDYKTESPQEFERVLTEANTFLSNPTADRYVAFIAEIPVVSRNNNIGSPDEIYNFHSAGFVYLITKNLNYGWAVRDLLVWQATEATTDFGNTTKYPITDPDSLDDKSPCFYFAAWTKRIIDCYIWTYALYTEAQHQVIQEFIFKAAKYFQTLINKSGEAQWNLTRYTESWVIDAGVNVTTLQGYAFYNGQEQYRPRRVYNNRRSMEMLAMAYAGVLFNTYGSSLIRPTATNVNEVDSAAVATRCANFITHSNLYIKEHILFGIFEDGLSAHLLNDAHRYEDAIISVSPDVEDPDLHEKGYTYTMVDMYCLLKASTLFYRNGLTNLINYSTNQKWDNVTKAFVTTGTTKSLENSALKWCEIYRGVYDGQIYACNFAANNNTNNYKLDGKIPSNSDVYILHAAWLAEANALVWKNSYITDTYLANYSGASYPILADTGSAGGEPPQKGGHAAEPCMLFRYGGLENLI